MIKLLNKEVKISSSILSFLFIIFGLMFFLPGYPVLCGAFFITLGIFQSFQNAVASNDITFSSLLPIAKTDIVRGKYIFSCFIELCGFIMMIISTAVRMTVLSQAAVYRNNALMNANPFSLGCALILFGLFNCVFICGFFKTGYKLTKPFVNYIIVCFIVIIIAEVLHHIPGLEKLNAFAFDNILIQLLLLILGIVLYLIMTIASFKKSCRNFDKIDL